MVKLRMTGLPEEVEATLQTLEDSFNVISTSDQYPNRNSKEVRVYVEVRQKEGIKNGKN